MIKVVIISLCIGVVAAVPSQALDLAAIHSNIHGFLDARYGQRLQSDPYQDDESIAEPRLQLELYQAGDELALQLRADIYYDAAEDQGKLDLENGSGWLDLREANLLFSPHPTADVKLGRQILTWGTGDLLFINDLFPKDWQSFFIGRDVDYLKAPSDAAMVSFFPEWASIDLIYTPSFDSDRYINGERISYWNSFHQSLAGQNAIIATEKPNSWFSDDEWALRISQIVSGYELSVYGYDGFWKSPLGYNAVTEKATFPRLRVLGASMRGGFGQGIGTLEGGYYDSLDDRNGRDPMLPNSEVRLLAGYEQEIIRDLMAGVQYYVEIMRDHDRYLAGAFFPATARDELRQVFTLRLTWQLLNQNLTLSAFTFYSPTDNDGYLRPVVKYKLDDTWTLSTGANLFWGEDDHTFFGQFSNNNNLYAGIRYSF